MAAPEYVELAPPPPLDGLVQCVWFLRGEMAGAPPQPVVPDGRMEIVLHRAEPFAQVDAAGVARRQAAVLLAGQLTAPVHLVPQGSADVIGIRFHPAGAGTLLRIPSGAVAGQVVPLVDVEGRLEAALRCLTDGRTVGRADRSDQEIVEVIARILSRFVQREPQAMVTEAVRALGQPRAPRIGELAARFGVTPRTLERRLVDAVGLAPKPLHRVLRFRRALRALERTPRGKWSEAAVRSGYFDQAHLIRDFRRFAGMPPSEFIAADAPLSRAIQGS